MGTLHPLNPYKKNITLVNTGSKGYNSFMIVPEDSRPLGPYSGPTHRRPRGETALLSWLRASGISSLKFCEMVGAHPKSVRFWMFGQSIPELVYAFKIEQATKGGVPVESWLGTEIAKLQWEHNGSSRSKPEVRKKDNQISMSNAKKRKALRAKLADVASEEPNVGTDEQG